MASLSNRVSLDTNVIFLRTMYAFSTNNVPVSTNFILGAGANGQIYAQDTLRNLEAYGVGYLPSTFSTLNADIISSGQAVLAGGVTADNLTSTQNYLLSTICSVQSNVNTLSSGISSVMESTFTSYNAQFSSLNSSFIGYVEAGSVSPLQLTSTANGVLAIESTNNGNLSNFISVNYVNYATFSNLSTGVSTQSNYFSVQVVQLSNNFTALSNFTRINLSNQSSQISSLNANVIAMSTYLITYSTSVGARFDSGGGGGGGVTVPEFEGLSSYVLTQSTTIRNISDSLSTNWSNTSNVSTYVVGLSTSVGQRIDSLGGGVTISEFQGLSSYVLTQSTTIMNISDSLSTNWSNTSNVSTYVLTLSTTLRNVSDSLSTNWSNTSNVSTYVRTLSTTLRNVSDSLSTNWSNTSNVSTYVVSLSTSVGQRFDSGGGGGTTISTNILYGTGNVNAAANTLVGGSANTSLANESAVIGSNNTLGASATNSFVCGRANNISGLNSIICGIQNTIPAPYSGNIVGGFNNFISNYNVIVTGSGNQLQTSANIYNGVIVVGLNNYVATTAEYSISIGIGNSISGSNSHIFGKTNSIYSGGSLSFCAGNDNEITSTNATVFGASNNSIGAYTLTNGYKCSGTASYSLTIGQYAKSRFYGSVTNAGITSTSNLYLVPGGAQTSITTMYCSVFAGFSNAFKYFTDNVQTVESNISYPTESGSQIMRTTRLTITGYEAGNASAVAGNGLYYGEFHYAAYVDNAVGGTPSTRFNITDLVTGIRTNYSGTGTLNVTLSTSRLVNLFVGPPVITVSIDVIPGFSHRIMIAGGSSSSNNFVARLETCEISQFFP